MDNKNTNQENIVQPNSSGNTNGYTGYISGQVSETSNNNQFQDSENSKIPFARYFKNKNRKKALVFIIVPVLLFAFAQRGPLWVAVMLMSPVLLAFIIYGIVLFFMKDESENVVQLGSLEIPLKTNGRKSYKHGVFMLIIGLILLLLAYLSVQSVRSSAGYSGSEGEIVALPFMFSGAVFIILSIVSLVVSFVTNILND